MTARGVAMFAARACVSAALLAVTPAMITLCALDLDRPLERSLRVVDWIVDLLDGAPLR